jgi:hypothetical protein
MLDKPPCTRTAWPVQTKEGPSGGEPQPEPFGSGRATPLGQFFFLTYSSFAHKRQFNNKL